ncbi:hypothetical protein Ahy_B06g080332 [Arachis hypogaea]|uniref:GRF-type domain-containing protein n=1 Tax=Arachis hypogaea TaxID=3818 RepID=A0A444YHQ7_ARAHY|nr:hypothetical protein Ahy_B06g080332 [Arachis hypogaea]
MSSSSLQGRLHHLLIAAPSPEASSLSSSEWQTLTPFLLSATVPAVLFRQRRLEPDPRPLGPQNRSLWVCVATVPDLCLSSSPFVRVVNNGFLKSKINKWYVRQQEHNGRPFCECGLRAPLQVSNSVANPCRKYYACPTRRCGWFRWACPNIQPSDSGDDQSSQLNFNVKTSERVEKLHADVVYLKFLMCGQLVVSVFCIVLIIVVLCKL